MEAAPSSEPAAPAFCRCAHISAAATKHTRGRMAARLRAYLHVRVQLRGGAFGPRGVKSVGRGGRGGQRGAEASLKSGVRAADVREMHIHVVARAAVKTEKKCEEMREGMCCVSARCIAHVCVCAKRALRACLSTASAWTCTSATSCAHSASLA
jgi:hypothetical protein